MNGPTSRIDPGASLAWPLTPGPSRLVRPPSLADSRQGPVGPEVHHPHRADIAGGEVPLDEVDQPNVVRGVDPVLVLPHARSEEHTSELQSLMRISYAVFCWKKK